MREHTKKHPTRPVKLNSSEREAVTAGDHFKKVYGNTPKPGIYLAGLRYREGLTQKDLSELIGVNQANISKMENGLRPIGKNMAVRLAEIFKTDYRLFL